MNRAVLFALPLMFLTGCSSGNPPAPPSVSPVTTAPVPTNAPTAPAQSAVPAEKNPPGDIPDNLAFVPYASAAGAFSFTHPEGWAETSRGTSVTFTDKLNGVQVMVGRRTAPPTTATARQDDVPALRASEAAFELRSVTSASVPSGTGVRIVYRRNSAPDAVTGRQYRDEVERYEIVRAGREVVVELYGPVGADNVDAYRIMIQSLQFR